MSGTASRAAPLAPPLGVDQRVQIEAAPERVWRALSESSELSRWLFPSATVDCRLGGRWEFTFPHWPSARGLWHPTLRFAGPIVALEPGAAIAVAFDPPYWGTVRFAIRAQGSGTELRITQDGFEGENAAWLADFRGGWGSFSDRLAALCEIDAVPSVRSAPELAGASAIVDPGELSLRVAALPVGLIPRWTVRHAGAELFLAGDRVPPGFTRARRAAHDELVVRVPATSAGPAAAALARSLARRGWASAGESAWFTPASGQIEVALLAVPQIDLARPEPFVRAFERAFCAPGRATAGGYFEPRGALELAGRPHPRPVPTPLARLPRQAIVRFDDLRLEGDVLHAVWEGSGWTGARNRGTSAWRFGPSGRIARLTIAGEGTSGR